MNLKFLRIVHSYRKLIATAIAVAATLLHINLQQNFTTKWLATVDVLLLLLLPLQPSAITTATKPYY